MTRRQPPDGPAASGAEQRPTVPDDPADRGATPTTEASGADESERFDSTTVTLMSGAHFAHDAYPAFTGVLLPLLIPKLGLTLAEAGLLASGIRWTTLLQPFLGYFADRMDTRYFVIAAPATTAICISMIGIAPSFFAVFVLLLLSGVSHAAFHPAAAAVVTRVAGNRWGKGMSFFMTGGELGRALGPLYIAAVLTMVGLDWSWIALVPGLVFSFLLYHRLHRTQSVRFRHPPGDVRAALRRGRRGLAALSTAIIFRSVSNGALVTFLPTLAVAAGAGIVYAGAALAVYEIGGTIGAFLGGTWSDRFGRRAVLAVGLVLGLPILVVALLMGTGIPQLLVLGVAGFFILSGGPVHLVTIQELLPENRSMATGISYFMTTGGAIGSMIGVGVLADAIGLRDALIVAAAIAFVALPAILLLPGRVEKHEPARAQ
jgi:MFS transporter, FSR family, fosmidomycin resistance protein